MHFTIEQIKQMRKISREQELERRKMVGAPRAKSWGGKPSNRQERRNVRQELANAH